MRNVLLLLSVIFLSACGASDSGNGGVIPQHQLDAMDKAEDVSDVLKQGDLQQRERMDESSGS